jgi:hypothetical protein
MHLAEAVDINIPAAKVIVARATLLMFLGILDKEKEYPVTS